MLEGGARRAQPIAEVRHRVLGGVVRFLGTAHQIGSGRQVPEQIGPGLSHFSCHMLVLQRKQLLLAAKQFLLLVEPGHGRFFKLIVSLAPLPQQSMGFLGPIEENFGGLLDHLREFLLPSLILLEHHLR